MWYDTVEFEELKGKTFTAIRNTGEELSFVCDTGIAYIQYHSQDCCESVSIEEIIGDLDDLIGSPILLAEEVSYVGETPEGVTNPEYAESYTWTFYKLATIKGSVTIRWFGSSNGYYSESVNLRKEVA